MKGPDDALGEDCVDCKEDYCTRTLSVTFEKHVILKDVPRVFENQSSENDTIIIGPIRPCNPHRASERPYETEIEHQG